MVKKEISEKTIYDFLDSNISLKLKKYYLVKRGIFSIFNVEMLEFIEGYDVLLDQLFRKHTIRELLNDPKLKYDYKFSHIVVGDLIKECEEHLMEASVGDFIHTIITKGSPVFRIKTRKEYRMFMLFEVEEEKPIFYILAYEMYHQIFNIEDKKKQNMGFVFKINNTIARNKKTRLKIFDHEQIKVDFLQKEIKILNQNETTMAKIKQPVENTTQQIERNAFQITIYKKIENFNFENEEFEKNVSYILKNNF